MTANEEKPMNVLVVGDWFVDENWIVTTESVPTSAHVGHRHYRSRIEDPHAQVLSLCGAGGVASLLHGLAQEGPASRPLEVFGLGVWDPNDTKCLACLFDGGKVLGQTPLTMYAMVEGPGASESSEEITCHQTADCLRRCPERLCKRMHSLGQADCGTWRVIRVYQRIGDRAPELLNRYDWEISRERMPTDHEIERAFEERPLRDTHFDVIAVVDHDKGGVTPYLVDRLSCRNTGARWYARCKNLSTAQSWLQIVARRLELLVSGPHRLDLSDGDPWFYGSHLSQSALEYLEKKTWGERVVVLHQDNHVAALDRRSNQVLVSVNPPAPRKIPVGRTTVLFSKLMADLLDHNGTAAGGDEFDFAGSLAGALATASRWCGEVEQILREGTVVRGTVRRDPESVDFRRHFGDALQRAAEVPSGLRMARAALDGEARAWESSREGLGILSRTGSAASASASVPRKKLQLWRGWSAVPGFICLSDARRRQIARLVREVRTFVQDPTRSRSLAAMLVARPGMGKSYLVKRLSEVAGVGKIEFNITHLSSVADLIACFDTIASRQNQEPDHPIIVFWDEINALIAGEQVYSYFLGPMWDGVYRRGGLTFRLRPCIWIFAGTRSPENEAKGSDFLSRLNGPVVNLSVAPETNGELDKLEQLYMGAALIRHLYPDVNSVSEGLLTFLRNARPKFGVRSLEFLISRLCNVSHGVVRLDNLPGKEDMKAWLEEVPHLSSGKDTSELVFIYDQPPT